MEIYYSLSFNYASQHNHSCDDDEESNFFQSLSNKLSHLKSLLVSPETSGCTSSESLHSSPGFAIEETKATNKNWIKSFKLPDTVSFKFMYFWLAFRSILCVAFQNFFAG